MSQRLDPEGAVSRAAQAPGPGAAPVLQVGARDQVLVISGPASLKMQALFDIAQSVGLRARLHCSVQNSAAHHPVHGVDSATCQHQATPST